MHMADALISPIVGGTMWVAAAGVATYSIRKIQNNLDDKKIPLMGVMGAFIFAAQMINFSIPGTGSSGHIGGGLILAILLGPYAGFLTMASILSIQALFFADGGLLALGCNILNLGFFTCFVAYPLIYKKIIKKGHSPKRIAIASMITAIIGLQMGAFSVVVETVLSGRTELPFSTFLLFMQPIHLAVGVVEGLITAAVAAFIWKARPEILERSYEGKAYGNIAMKRVLVTLTITALIIVGAFTWFASTDPDGLEWSISKIVGADELSSRGGIYKIFSDIQNKIVILPDYAFRASGSKQQELPNLQNATVISGSSTSGLVGGIITLTVVTIIGMTVRVFKRKVKVVP